MKLRLTRAGHFLSAKSIFGLLALFIATGVVAQQAGSELPEVKQTHLGLYLTAAEAFDKWQADPGNVIVLDVRTTEEYIYVGHAPMARNVPLAAQTHTWDAEKQYFAFLPNPDFITQVKGFAEPSDTLVVMCRSGGRSAMAVNQLAEAGFTQVYQIIDGFEGDAVKDPDSVFVGKRLKNGWKNSGLPWTYQPDPELMSFVANKAEE